MCKLIAGDRRETASNLRRAVSFYMLVVEYVKRNPESQSVVTVGGASVLSRFSPILTPLFRVQDELSISVEMITLLPMKIERILKGQPF